MGKTGKQVSFFLFPFSIFLATSCGDARPEPQGISIPPVEEVAVDFDPAAVGTVQGQVTWAPQATEAVLEVPPFEVRPNPLASGALREKLVRENPNAPAIDPQSRGVGNAVVFLRGVDIRKARPWDQPTVRVEQRERRLHVLQGESASHYGFVRRGEAVEMVSKEAVLHSLRASGAAFFTLSFPDPGQPLSRRLHEQGVVELSSGAGYYWMRAYLFVDDHPYYARTDAKGRFVLPQVPEGTYELVCWMPSWIKAAHARDPETALITRMTFRPALEQTQPVTLKAGEMREVGFKLDGRIFER